MEFNYEKYSFDELYDVLLYIDKVVYFECEKWI